VEWLAGEAKPPGSNWSSDQQEAVGAAALHVLADASVDPTDARKPPATAERDESFPAR
jgi:hypothetical protein